MYQMGARFYQPATGRFTQQDPRPSSAFEPNRYHYAAGDPVNYTDKSALEIDYYDLSASSGAGRPWRR